MISSRKLEDLHPTVKSMAERFVDQCHAAGIDVLIYCTYRDAEAQNALYAQGRTIKGDIVTNARGGQSMHQYRVAFDFVPLLHGKAQWKDANKYMECVRIAEEIGFESAARWSGKLKETAHLQFTNGLSLSDFQRGKTI